MQCLSAPRPTPCNDHTGVEGFSYPKTPRGLGKRMFLTLFPKNLTKDLARPDQLQSGWGRSWGQPSWRSTCRLSARMGSLRLYLAISRSGQCLPRGRISLNSGGYPSLTFPGAQILVVVPSLTKKVNTNFVLQSHLLHKQTH